MNSWFNARYGTGWRDAEIAEHGRRLGDRRAGWSAEIATAYMFADRSLYIGMGDAPGC